jgi:hypothetical protein
MSHVTAIKNVPIKDLNALQSAVAELGGTLHLNQKTYKWFGRHVGDYPLPAGMTVDDLGKCECAAQFGDVNYEVGFAQIKGEDGLFPLFDFWGSSGIHDGKVLEGIIGSDAGKLMQAYSKHAAINAATLAGYNVLGVTSDAEGNVHLEIAIH